MHLMYYMNEKGGRVYTLKVRDDSRPGNVARTAAVRDGEMTPSGAYRFCNRSVSVTYTNKGS
jgi:hypothetical protein